MRLCAVCVCSLDSDLSTVNKTRTAMDNTLLSGQNKLRADVLKVVADEKLATASARGILDQTLQALTVTVKDNSKIAAAALENASEALAAEHAANLNASNVRHEASFDSHDGELKKLQDRATAVEEDVAGAVADGLAENKKAISDLGESTLKSDRGIKAKINIVDKRHTDMEAMLLEKIENLTQVHNTYVADTDKRMRALEAKLDAQVSKEDTFEVSTNKSLAQVYVDAATEKDRVDKADQKIQDFAAENKENIGVQEAASEDAGKRLRV